ncbi:MAG: ATP-binding protein [Chloroflexota bacterium]
MQREFNIFGPVYSHIHYHVERTEVKSAVHKKVENGRYFTLNAARQTGKTTIFREVIAELEATGEYFGILLSFEGLRGHSQARFYEELTSILTDRNLPILKNLVNHENLPKPQSLADHSGFMAWIRQIGTILNRQGLLIIDEFDAAGAELAEPMLGAFRDMYLHRHEPTRYVLQSIVLVGVRNIPALLGGTQSPFNIADQYEVPYFTHEETSALLNQHTDETGQPFMTETIDEIYRESQGQPFLVNRLAQILTQDIVPNRSRSILPSHMGQAMVDLLAENNTHFASITSKAMSHRTRLLPILFYDEKRSNFREPVTQELLMYGILRKIRNQGVLTASIANPIYRKMLILTFSPSNGDVPAISPVHGSFRHRYIVDGVLNMDGLMDSFKRMMEEHGVQLLRSKQTYRPLEIGGQYLLLSYLTAALDSIGGYVALESINSAGEMDLVVVYLNARFIIETKVWYGKKRFEDGQAQLVGYLKAASLDKGYIVLFSEKDVSTELGRPDNQPFEVDLMGKTLRQYPIIISASET